jgi:hypothetical protein
VLTLARRASFDVAPLAPGWPQTAELSDFIATPPVPRSHALRGNAVFDALRRPPIRTAFSWGTASEDPWVPELGLRGDAERRRRHSHGGPWERGLPLCRSSGGIDEVLKRATPKRASEGIDLGTLAGAF